ncbi:MAG: sugar nucleotide-binding protein, partial [Kiritimatiellae bacterium]|nr:sugar nucleotide-binding protein [Kiritimatiellia bacterium]
CRPDVCFHLAVGPVDWTGLLADYAARRAIPFVHTSSVSVYGGHQTGPFSIHDVPEPQDDYGRYKKAGEDRIADVYPGAVLVRIGWQIGLVPGANHMVDHLTRTQAEQGRITASRNWFQACSFLDDTARTLVALAEGNLVGLVHLDANPGISFYELVAGLKQYLKTDWILDPSDEPALDNRLLDDRISIASVVRW